MRRFKVVKKGEDGKIEEASFSETMRAVTEEALADGATAVMIVWQAPGRLEYRTIPNSEALMRGFLEMLGEKVYSEEDND